MPPKPESQPDQKEPEAPEAEPKPKTPKKPVWPHPDAVRPPQHLR